MLVVADVERLSRTFTTVKLKLRSFDSREHVAITVGGSDRTFNS